MSDFKVAGKMSLDGSAFFSTMKGVRSSINGLGGMLAGAFSIGAITAFSKSVLDLAGNLKDVSDALNINVEYLQKFLNSARTSGGSLEGIQKFLAESNKSRQAAVNEPTGKEAQAFGRLGFSAQDISQLNSQQFMDKIIASFSTGITPQKLNDIKEIGGKSAISLANGFKDGLDTVTPIMTSDVVSSLDQVGDKFTTLGVEIKARFAPVILDLINGFERLFSVMKKLSILTTSTWAEKFVLRQNIERLEGKADKTSPEKATLKKWKQDLSDLESETMTESATRRISEYEESERQRIAREASDADAKRKAKDSTDNTSPNFQKNDGGIKTSAKSGTSISSDSLTSVGNFLGSGATSSLESIGNQQLAVQQSIAEWTKRTHELLKNSNGIPAT